MKLWHEIRDSQHYLLYPLVVLALLLAIFAVLTEAAKPQTVRADAYAPIATQVVAQATIIAYLRITPTQTCLGTYCRP